MSEENHTKKDESNDYRLPDELSIDFIEKLSELFAGDQYAKLLLDDNIYDSTRNQIYDSMMELLPERKEIFRQMTSKGYFEQEIPMPGLEEDSKLVFRTLSRMQQDETQKWVSTQDFIDSMDRTRLIGFRRTCHGVLGMDGTDFAVPVPAPYHENSEMELFVGFADQVSHRLKSLPVLLTDQITELYGIWELAVNNTISASNLIGLAGNSMRR